jgi:uncharacterized protein YkwD
MPGPRETCDHGRVPAIARRLSAPLLSVLLLAALAGSAAASLPGYDEATIVKAGLDQVRLANLQRTSHGLIALQLDPTLMSIARDRADVMAENDVLSHTEPGGGNAFDRISTAGITAYAAGEIIAWNTYNTEPDSVDAVIKAWMKSPGHHDIMMSNNYNYVGFGAAVAASGKRYYAGVFVKSPDHTGAWVKTGRVTKKTLSSTRTKLTVNWVGGDTRLQVLTTGLRNYEIMRRVDDGGWQRVGTTLLNHVNMTLARHHTYRIMIRASDKVGNWGTWRSITVKL